MIDPNRLLAAGYPDEVKEVLQNYLVLQQEHESLVWENQRLRSDLAEARGETSYLKTVHAEAVARWQRVQEWLTGRPA